MNKPTAKDMIELPDYFVFKIIVKPDLLDEARLLQIASWELGRDLGTPEVNVNRSRNGKFLSYSVRLYIEVYEEIEKLYVAYQGTSGVVMTL